MSKTIFKGLQQDLKDLDFYQLEVDGLWGNGSQTAWKAAVDYMWQGRDIITAPEPLVMQKGDRGEHIAELQRELNRVGHNLIDDGVFGPATERAVVAFQNLIGIVNDGRVGEKTLAALKGFSFPETLTQFDIEQAAEMLSVSVQAIMAVSEVESRGRGFFNNGLPAILFERHIMRRRLITHKLSLEPHITNSPNIVNASPGGYIGGVREYNRLELAKEIHTPSARESCSWGAYQIMGFHWEALGYSSVEDYVTKMKLNEGEHLKAFVRFILIDKRLHNALRTRDWTTFARVYNGPAFAKNQYDVKMAKAYARLGSLEVA